MSLAGLIDVAAEIKRLEKQLAEKRKHLQGTGTSWRTASFVGQAPAEVVQQQRDLVAELEKQIKTIEDTLRRTAADVSKGVEARACQAEWKRETIAEGPATALNEEGHERTPRHH